MDDVRKSLAQWIAASAVKELAYASVLNTLASKIGKLDCRDGDCLEVLSALRDLTCETLRLSVDRGKTDSTLLQDLLKALERCG